MWDEGRDLKISEERNPVRPVEQPAPSPQPSYLCGCCYPPPSASSSATPSETISVTVSVSSSPTRISVMSSKKPASIESPYAKNSDSSAASSTTSTSK